MLDPKSLSRQAAASKKTPDHVVVGDSRGCDWYDNGYLFGDVCLLCLFCRGGGCLALNACSL